MKSIVIYVVSDKPNDIGELLVRAGMRCFEKSIREVRLHPFVDDKIGIDSVLDLAGSHEGLIVYHFFSEDLKAYFEQETRRRHIPIYDAKESLVETLRGITGETPVRNCISDILLDPEYMKKVDAIEYAVRCDDGKNPKELVDADIVLIGVSRTSKTPISIYLANKQYKVANIPLIPEVDPPEELYKIPKEKIFGLILDPHRLVSIRSERIRSMGIAGESRYGSYDRVITELEKAQVLFDKIGCTVIDVTSKAIEEIAAIILANVMRR